MYLIGLAVAVFVVGVRLLPGSFSFFRTRDIEYMLNRDVPITKRLGVFLLEIILVYLLFVVVVWQRGVEIRF